jgi:oligopeptide/dipeptide ABC transporter ATP-binding protein
MRPLRDTPSLSAIPSAANQPLLAVEQLTVGVPRRAGDWLPLIDAVNLALERNHALGIVGESGSGKTMLCRSLIGTLPRHGAAVMSGRIVWNGTNIAGAPERVWRRVRGREIGYVPQSSLAGLNPVLSVGTQLVEALRAASPLGGAAARREALRLLELVHIPRAALVLDQRAHQLSGGMRQRVMIAAALAQQPQLLVADEPTTALDVTVQREILTLIGQLRRDLGMALILISHDLAVIEEVCDSVMVMYAGASAELGPLDRVARQPRHPYTRALQLSRVDLAPSGQDLEAIPGEPPGVGAWPTGCRFWPRCAWADDACREGNQPPLRPFDGRLTACIHADRLDAP